MSKAYTFLKYQKFTKAAISILIYSRSNFSFKYELFKINRVIATNQ